MAWSEEKRRVRVEGLEMAYVERGAGRPIVLLHGNPTSSYLWRDVLPHLEGLGRCIAPDLVGMGDSDPLPESGPGSYRFVEHRHYLDGLLAALGLERDVVLVLHDWGSGLGFDWANRHRDAVAGIAYTEAIVRPVTWAEWPESARGFFRRLRGEEGEELILERNLFVERVLPASVVHPLTEETMAEYRRPFTEAGERRRPTLAWPREIPADGEPSDVVEIVGAYADWLAATPGLPKLWFDATPGAILVGPQRDFCAAWPDQQVVEVRAGHFVPEDAGEEMGRAIARWITEHVARG